MATATHPIAALTEALAPVEPTDTIAAAGRKLILADSIRLLALEDGVRSSDDPEFVHDMRVATRRMRSSLRLLKPYYRRKHIKRLNRSLRWLARLLGGVRDLDVLLDELKTRGDTALDGVISRLTADRDKAFRKLIAGLNSGDFTDLTNRLAAFALDSDDPLADSGPLPVEVRHVVPVLLHQQLAAVRGFDPLFENGVPPDYKTLHALRIAFKQLRYATASFIDVLGVSAETFVSEIKSVQDHLGRLNDVVVFEARLREGINDALIEPALARTLASLRAEAETMAKSFTHAWHRFNSRAVQKLLAEALLLLR